MKNYVIYTFNALT